MFLVRFLNINASFRRRSARGAWFLAMLALAAFGTVCAQTKTDTYFLDFATNSPFNDDLDGIASDGTTMWVADSTDQTLYAYKMSDMTADTAKNIAVSTADADLGMSARPSGLFSDGTTIWVSSAGLQANARVIAYKVSDRTRDAAKDFKGLHAHGNSRPYGIWANGTTMYIADLDDAKVYAYNQSTKARDSGKDITLLSGMRARDMWSDGATLWVIDARATHKVAYAWELAGGRRDFGKDIILRDLVGNPYGLHGSGNVLWVGDAQSPRNIRAVNIATKQRATRPFLRFSPMDATEGSPLTINVTAHKADGSSLAVPLTVNWRWKAFAGSATRGSDYTASNFSAGAAISAGMSAGAISIPTIDDSDAEGAETVEIDMTQLENGAFDFNIAAANQVVTVAILDDDGITISEPAAVTEGASIEFVVNLGNPPASAVTVTYITAAENAANHAAAGAQATDGSDYTGTSGDSRSIVFQAGRTNATITVATLDDTLDEEDTEVFGVLLESFAGSALPRDTNCLASDTRACGFINDNDALPFLRVTPRSVTEGGQLEFIPRLVNSAGEDAVSGRDVRVTFGIVAGGSATETDDYVTRGSQNRRVYAGNSSGQVFSVRTVDDSDSEDSETIWVEARSPLNARFEGAATAITVVGTITDNDLPAVAIAADDADNSVAEGDEVVFTVSLSQTHTAEVSPVVNVSQTGRVADLRFLAGVNVPIAAGAMSAKLTIPTQNDNTDEDDGAITATIGALPASHRPGTMSSATVAVTDDEDAPALRLPLAVSAADTAEHVVVTITLAPAGGEAGGAVTDKEVSVEIETPPNGSAVAGTDYTAIPAGRLTFAPGANELHITIDIIAPDADENVDNFYLDVRSPVNAFISGGDCTLCIPISLLEKPTLSITADASVNEGETAVFTINLSMPHTAPLSVPISVAQSGDVTRFTGTTITFPPGATRGALNVATINDNVDEPDGSITATIGALPDTHAGSGNNATVTVADDDRVPTINIMDTETTEGRALSFPARLSNPSAHEITVRYASRPGTASANDYQDTSGTLTFPALTVERRIEVMTATDTETDPDETVLVMLSTPSMHATLGVATATGTIREGLSASQLGHLNATVAPRLAMALGNHVATILGDRVYAALAGRPSEPGLSLRGLEPMAFLTAAGPMDQSNYRERLALDADEVAFTTAMPFAGVWPWLKNRWLELGSLALWGRGYHGATEYDADDAMAGGLRFDGDVKGILLGMDAHSDDLMLGFALNHSRAELDYHVDNLSGRHDTTLAGIHPYIGRTIAEQVRVWGGLGLNNGVMTVKEEHRDTKFNVHLRTAQLGVDGGLHNASDRNDAYRLAVRADIRHARMRGRPQHRGSRAQDFITDNLAARAGLSYAYSRDMGNNGEWGANSAVNLRHERGAGAGGNGVELGGGVKYHLGNLRAHLEASALAAHSEDLKEWAISAGLTWFAPSQLGWNVSFAPHWGSQQATAGYQLAVHYGIGLTDERETITLFARDHAMETRHDGHHYGLGADYQLGERFTAGYEAVIEPESQANTDHRGYVRYVWRF